MGILSAVLKENYIPITGLAVVVPLLLIILQKYGKSSRKSTAKPISVKPYRDLPKPVISPVSSDFDWKSTKPVQYRPFKNGAYRMTLSTRRLDPLDHIILEESYLERTNLRIKVLEKQDKLLYGCHESAVESLKEAYDYVFDYLMNRYPMYFYKIDNDTTFYNKIRDESFPLNNSKMTPKEMIMILARNIEEDLLILVRQPGIDDVDEYYLRCAISCFPAGFNPSAKLNTPLTSIHKPVPEYKEKLQLSMNRFFMRLSPYEYFVRNNWGFQLGTELCDPDGYQAPEEELEQIKAAKPEDLDFNKVFLRVEKQMFTRMPKTKNLLFLSRYYTYPITKIREEEEEKSQDLIGAIDGIPYRLGLYKRRIYWGDAIKAYLRRETNGSTDEIYECKMTA